MIKLLLLVFLLFAGLITGSFIAEQQGYLLLVLENWTVQISFVKFCVLMFVAVILFLFIEWLLKKVLRWLLGSRRWLGESGQRREEGAFHNGILLLAEGEYSKARQAFLRSGKEKHQGIALLATAEVELRLGNIEQAQQLWLQASEYKKAALAAHTQLLSSLLRQQKADMALTHIESVPEKLKKQPKIIALWAQALAQAGHWQLLQDKLKGWRKVLGEDYAPLMQQASKGNFAEIASRDGANLLKDKWGALPRSVRRDVAQQAAYIQQLLDQNMYVDAEKALVEYQKKPEPILVPLFKQLRLSNPVLSVQKIQQWLKQDDSNVALLSALGHIAFYAKDYALAEKVLERAIKLSAQQDDILLMAELKTEQQEPEKAIALYKQSLRIS